MINRFNIRVYGIALNIKKEVLLCTENHQSILFTKFPGGGLEFGEGIADCLQREFGEETNTSITIIKHFYTTDFFQRSAFIKTDQLISVYYLVKLNHELAGLHFSHQNTTLHFFWKPIQELSEEDVTFPIDKHVVTLLKKNFDSLHL
ncbi:MAG: NUDIX domain-containing protein [Bacteroidetes bacterium]|nr:NUDIX domain-containing protein [Bacteroidota bacterium]